MCAKAFAEAMEAVPFTLAENCGLKPLEIIGELREQHEKGEGRMGIDVRKGKVGDMEKARVLQPALVSLRAVALATECVRMVLKIDGIVQTARD
ncbi:hypothetical protein MHBO_001941 [Bonamia ostreae]|uniref:T-complex protein 1 subunit delta n=1 Tax=Bonamia ostreae TaxID=126728 RepID=A0ABV2AKN9_9EUKA